MPQTTDPPSPNGAPVGSAHRLRRPPTPAQRFTGRDLVIKGARQHNLKDVDLTIPKRKLVVFTGPSGSGKSSLVFDT
ncbi:MAG: hypothetical protein R3362_08270, partial [Rhodothermales bacterium]|nr:hypothetical protein [Rhodothermales bacterium]